MWFPCKKKMESRSTPGECIWMNVFGWRLKQNKSNYYFSYILLTWTFFSLENTQCAEFMAQSYFREIKHLILFFNSLKYNGNKLFSLIKNLFIRWAFIHDIVMHNWCSAEGITFHSLLISFTGSFNCISNYIYFHKATL